MEIIKDLRTLKPIAKKFNLKVDREFKYILNDLSLKETRDLRALGFELKYFSGCFYPYLIKIK